MVFIQMTATIIVIALLIYAVSKKFNAATALLSIGLIVLAVLTIINGVSVLGDSGIGSRTLDLFEYIANQFASQTTSIGILIMSVMGFVTYMNHIKASNLLALLAAKPLRKLKSPYIAVASAFMIGAALKLFIPSHGGLTTLLVATVYPILIELKVKKLTAAGTVLLSGTFDFGIADTVTNTVVKIEGISEQTSISEFFVNQQLPVSGIVVIVTLIVFLIVSIRADKKTADENITASAEQDPKEFGIPVFFALLPAVPLCLVFIFSKIIAGTIILSVVAANLIGFAIAFICNLVFSRKSKTEIFNESQKFYEGMGQCFSSVVVLIIGASVFTSALNGIGGIKIILNSIASSGSGGILTIFAASLITLLTATITGSGMAAVTTIAPLMPSMASAAGINVLKTLVPIIHAGGMARSIAPVNAALIIASRMCDVEIMDLVRRNLVPVTAGFAASVLASMILL